MGSAKGSIKDRIRYWKNMRKQKKLKEQQELEAYRIEKAKQGIYINPNPKKYNIFQVWIKSFVGLLVGLFASPKKEVKKSNPSIQLLQEIQILEQEVEEIKSVDVAQTYYQKVEQKEQVIKQVMLKENLQTKPTHSKEIKECMEQLEVVKQKLQKIAPLESKKTEPETVEAKSQSQEPVGPNLSSEIKTQSIKGAEVKEVPVKRQPEMDGIASKQPSKKVVVVQEIPSEQIVKPMDYKAYIVETNKKIKDHGKTLEKLKKDVESAKTPYQLYQVESDILWLQKQLYEMEKIYSEISKEKEFQYLKDQVEYYSIDKNDILKDDESIQKLILECKSQIEKIDYKAKQSTKEAPVKEEMKKEEPVKEKKIVKEEKKEEKKKEKPKEYYLDIDDFNNLRTQVMNDLNQQVMEIKTIQLTTAPTGFFQKIRTFLSNTIVSVMPIFFFKNKLAGILTSSIVAHNRIRTMRQMMSNQQAIYETGETLFTQIQSKQDCLTAIQLHLNGSLTELQQLKADFITKYQALYPVETEQLLEQMNHLEQQLLEKSMSLQMSQQKLTQTKRKYQKTMKKAGNYYNKY